MGRLAGSATVGELCEIAPNLLANRFVSCMSGTSLPFD